MLPTDLDSRDAWEILSEILRLGGRCLPHGLDRRGLDQQEAGLVLGDEDRAHEPHRLALAGQLRGRAAESFSRGRGSE